MKLEAIDQKLRRAGALLVDPRVVRRVIKAHRDIVGLQVPHTHCYAMTRTALLALAQPAELGLTDPVELPEEVVLVARPAPADVAHSLPQDLLGRLWRTIFHAKVHLALDRLVAEGRLDGTTIRKRINAIGRVEFDEIRTILRHDDRLLPPGDEREQYTEFVALYLELKHFAPELVATTFPGLADQSHVDHVLAGDVDAHALLDQACPDGADPAGTIVREPPRASRTSFTPSSRRADSSVGRPPSERKARRLLKAADKAKAKGNDVRSALLRATAATALDDRDVEERVRVDLRDLSARINRALSLRDGLDADLANVQWASLLWMLVDEAVRARRLRYSVEARLLYDLQLAAVAHEKPQSAVDLVTAGLSRGRRPVVRPLPATREVRIARRVHIAAKKVRHTHVDAPDRKLLAKMMRWAAERVDRNVRLALRPEITGVLSKVGLEPRDAPEQLARDKLVEELLDRIVKRGFVSFAHLRDTLSRNQLKLEDLAGPRQWLSGDQLLEADRQLGEVLDGVYRPGEFYLRGLQRLSSLPFGTQIGRILFLFLLLPFGASFIVLEGLGHIIVAPIAKATGYGALTLLTWPSFLATAVVVLGLVHIPLLRTAAWKLLSAIGWVLVTLFVRIPRWILRRTLVKRVLRTRAVKATFRRVAVPLVLTALAVLFTPLGTLPIEYAVGASVGTFGMLSLLMTWRVGEWAELVLYDWFAPRWRTFSNQVVPGLLRLIAELFRRLVDRLDRALYRVDELLRFRGKPNALSLGLRALAALLWFLVAYIIRLYVLLLIEPMVNPVKYVPVGMVSHKLAIPYWPTMLSGLQGAFSPVFGQLVGYPLAWVTAFFLPSVGAFFAWELLANWKLYRASRFKVLKAAQFGTHGETMGQLMIPGVHSGTLPKLHSRLRQAAQREDEAARALSEKGHGRPAAEGARGRFREGMEEVELAVRRFVERELIALLTRCPHWTAGPVEVSAVHLVSNRVRVALSCPGLGAEPCELAFEEKDGLVVASMTRAGFVRALPAEPHPLRTVFENGLAGLYQLAGVDVVREQIAAALGEDAHYDFVAGRLVVWPDQDYRTELSYRLEGALRGARMKAKMKGVMPQHPPPILDRTQVVFRKQTIRWEAWVGAWNPRSDGSLPRLLDGPTILPAVGSAAPQGPVAGGPQGPASGAPQGPMAGGPQTPVAEAPPAPAAGTTQPMVPGVSQAPEAGAPQPPGAGPTVPVVPGVPQGPTGGWPQGSAGG